MSLLFVEMIMNSGGSEELSFAPFFGGDYYPSGSGGVQTSYSYYSKLTYSSETFQEKGNLTYNAVLNGTGVESNHIVSNKQFTIGWLQTQIVKFLYSNETNFIDRSPSRLSGPNEYGGTLAFGSSTSGYISGFTINKLTGTFSPYPYKLVDKYTYADGSITSATDLNISTPKVRATGTLSFVENTVFMYGSTSSDIGDSPPTTTRFKYNYSNETTTNLTPPTLYRLIDAQSAIPSLGFMYGGSRVYSIFWYTVNQISEYISSNDSITEESSTQTLSIVRRRIGSTGNPIKGVAVGGFTTDLSGGYLTMYSKAIDISSYASKTRTTASTPMTRSVSRLISTNSMPVGPMG